MKRTVYSVKEFNDAIAAEKKLTSDLQAKFDAMQTELEELKKDPRLEKENPEGDGDGDEDDEKDAEIERLKAENAALKNKKAGPGKHQNPKPDAEGDEDEPVVSDFQKEMMAQAENLD